MKLSDRLQRAALRRIFSLSPRVLRRIAGAPVTSPDGFTLGVHEQILLRAVKLVGHREAPDVGVTRTRIEMDRAAPIVDCVPVALRSITGRTIAGPGGPIPVRIYEPEGGRAVKPVLVFFHGGGFVVGSLESHHGVCCALAAKADAVVVSVAYRLAPEHRFPAGVDDALAATRWAIREAASLGGDPRAVSVGGDSAGGNLAAVVSQETRSDAVRPVLQILVYPATDLTRALPSHRMFRDGFMLTERGLDFYLDQYLNDVNEKKDPRGSPLFAKDLSGLPPAVVITAGFDPLRDEGRAYADAMRAAGVRVDYTCVEGSIHGFFSFGGVMDHARRAVDAAAAALSATAPREGQRPRPASSSTCS